MCVFLWFSGSYADAEYWTEVIDLPPFGKRVPAHANNPNFKKSPISVLAVVQLLDDLGRKQVAELDRYLAEFPEPVPVAVFSLDELKKQWPVEYLEATIEKLGVSTPVFKLDREGRKGLYKGYDQKLLRELPEIMIFDLKRSLHRVLKGVHTAEEIDRSIQEVLSPPQDEEPSGGGGAVGGLTNGGFEDWSVGEQSPEGWLIYDVTGETLLRAEGMGWQKGLAAEIRGHSHGKRQIIYQQIENPMELAGRKVRLSASVRGNCISKLVVALATIQVGGGRYRFIPKSPYVTPNGEEIPFRIVAACDFADGTSAWQHMKATTTIPESCRILVVMVYLTDPKPPRGAAYYLDDIKVEPVP